MRYTLIVGFIGGFYLYLDGITRCIEIRYMPKIISEIWHWTWCLNKKELTIDFWLGKHLIASNHSIKITFQLSYMHNECSPMQKVRLYWPVFAPSLQKNHAGVHVHHDAGGRTLGWKGFGEAKIKHVDLQVCAELACPWCQQPTAREHPEAADRYGGGSASADRKFSSIQHKSHLLLLIRVRTCRGGTVRESVRFSRFFLFRELFTGWDGILLRPAFWFGRRLQSSSL